MSKAHTFHIPVMGIGYTIDTPLKVAHLGIDSVISLVDDIILEKLRKMYSMKYKLPYDEISEKTEDFRAKRITSYLNMINSLAQKKFELFKTASIDKIEELKDYFQLLPENSDLKAGFSKLISGTSNFDDVTNWVKEKLAMGSIDVNIMTKLDKNNFRDNKQLPQEYNDAHAALRGYARSDLKSSLIFSAGMNPGLYNYLEQFDDFYPDINGVLKKKIVLKVTDYRSALIQGKYLAKKGLWVTEFRVESGLNCGGHAFASAGFLLGPILSEFKHKRSEMTATLHDIYKEALKAKNKTEPETDIALRITAQGGVGTAEEHAFILNHYQLDSVGWGSPFLLVPEAVNVDDNTLKMLARAKEDDIYLSNISPLGIPFNSLKGNSKDIHKTALITKGRPGSSCPKRFLALNNEFSEKGMCTASREYQFTKIKELNTLQLPPAKYKSEYDKIVDKSCICVGLGTVALLVNDLDTRVEGEGVTVCPGPNMAYFSKTMKLHEIIDHIYGRTREFIDKNRPNMFIKELNIYMDYLQEKISETGLTPTKKEEKYLTNFVQNLQAGTAYYLELFQRKNHEFMDSATTMAQEFSTALASLSSLHSSIKNIGITAVKK